MDRFFRPLCLLRHRHKTPETYALVGFVPGTIFIQIIALYCAHIAGHSHDHSLIRDVAKPFGGVILARVTFKLQSTPFAFPIPFI